jgi:hypothetical protein
MDPSLYGEVSIDKDVSQPIIDSMNKAESYKLITYKQN